MLIGAKCVAQTSFFFFFSNKVCFCRVFFATFDGNALMATFQQNSTIFKNLSTSLYYYYSLKFFSSILLALFSFFIKINERNRIKIEHLNGKQRFFEIKMTVPNTWIGNGNHSVFFVVLCFVFDLFSLRV